VHQPTGYTNAAGYSLIFAADRNDNRLIGVILGETVSGRRFRTAERLLDWAGESTAAPGGRARQVDADFRASEADTIRSASPDLRERMQRVITALIAGVMPK
jgi:D-alanyl-D-alanine carboxypeptidase